MGSNVSIEISGAIFSYADHSTDLHEPFLLPSLVGAIYWMIAYAKEQRGADLALLLQIIQRVARAPSSPDAQAMHATIMYIVGLPLTNCLKTLRKNNPKRNDIDPIISNLKPYIDFRRRPYNPCHELRAWRASPGSLKQSLRVSFQSLIIWSSAINPQLSPPHYNPRLILIAECILGAPTTLSVLLEEVKVQTELPNGNAAVALDIATALICAPKSENSPLAVGWVNAPVPAQPAKGTKRMNLREALKLEFDTATDLVQKDQFMAETIVRLHRSVEAQLNISITPIPDVAAPSLLPMSSINISTVDQAIDFGTDANVTGMDLDAGANGMHLGLSDTLIGGDLKMDGDDDLFGQGGSGMNDDDDIFGDLDFNNMDGMGGDYYP